MLEFLPEPFYQKKIMTIEMIVTNISNSLAILIFSPALNVVGSAFKKPFY